MKSLDTLLLSSLREGAKVLSSDAHSAICDYVRSQMTENGAFINRGGKADLYYTMFGWMLCYVLGIKLERRLRHDYLYNIDITTLDCLHATVYRHCELINAILDRGLFGAALTTWHKRHNMDDFLRHFFRHTVGKSVNGEAARLFSNGGKGIDTTEKANALTYIRGRQDETGGFFANENAPLPDLLTTAVALFTLRAFNVKPAFDAYDFIDAHFRPDGSFMPNLIDDDADVEYVFYGLLAMGNLGQGN